jgi:hypothetical protein
MRMFCVIIQCVCVLLSPSPYKGSSAARLYNNGTLENIRESLMLACPCHSPIPQAGFRSLAIRLAFSLVEPPPPHLLGIPEYSAQFHLIPPSLNLNLQELHILAPLLSSPKPTSFPK